MLKDQIDNIYYEDIVETVREPMLVLDSDLVIISANRNFYDTFKVTPKKTTGRLIYDLGDKQWDIPQLRTLLEEILPKEKKFDNYEVEHVFPTIGHKIMLLNARRITHKGIGSQLILLAIEDITERRRLEGLLEESEERYKRIFETANDGILLLEKSKGNITHANPTVTAMLGYSKEECIGNKLKDVGFPRDKSNIKETLHTLERDGIIYYNDTPIKTKAGQTIDVDVYLVDRVNFVQCNIRDITQRKQSVTKLKESEKKYRELYDFLPIPVYEMDFETNITSANRAIYEAVRGTEEDLKKGIKGWQLLSPKDINKSRKNIERLLSGEQVKGTEYNVTRLDGTVFPAIVISSVISSNDKPIGLRGAIIDITERKQAEDDLQQSFVKMRKSLGATVNAMAVTVETRDPYTAGHQRRVADLARTIATEMNLSSDQIDGIRMAATIHDLGKISIPSEILSKPTELTNLEFSLIKTHPESGHNILKDIDFPWPIARIVLEHHERMNGSGYPNGLTGDNLLLESRILAVADVVEAMSSHRPYRPGRGIDAALEEIAKGRGVLYDSEVADACLRLFKTKNYKITD